MSIMTMIVDWAEPTMKVQLQVTTTGIFKNDDSVVMDTTGAGDAFIGGYLHCCLTCPTTTPRLLAMQFATWVAGKKLQGSGGQTALPTAAQVEQELGRGQHGQKSKTHSRNVFYPLSWLASYG
jgi:pfkB family carbohydrate kinase